MWGKLCSANVANDLGFFFFQKLAGEIICIQHSSRETAVVGIEIFSPPRWRVWEQKQQLSRNSSSSIQDFCGIKATEKKRRPISLLLHSKKIFRKSHHNKPAEYFCAMMTPIFYACCDCTFPSGRFFESSEIYIDFLRLIKYFGYVRNYRRPC